MKSYNEVAESVFERRENYLAEKKARTKIIKRTVSAVSCCCLVALLGFGVLQSGIFEQTPSTLVTEPGKNSDINQGGTIVADNIIFNEIEKPEDHNRLAFLEYRDCDLSQFAVSQKAKFPADLTIIENEAAYNVEHTASKPINTGDNEDAFTPRTGLLWHSLSASTPEPEDGRFISIDFSEKNYPGSSLGYGDGEISTINGNDVTLYHYSNDYAAKFALDGCYYFVHSMSVTEEEFLATLSSIL